MAGGLINLATYGAQDLYLTGTPEITFFKVVYRRHTNFSMESIEVNFDDTFGFDKESNVVIPAIGDLIHKIYLKVKLPYVHLLGRKKEIQNALIKMEEAKNNLYVVQKFMELNTRAYRRAVEQYNINNVTSAKYMINVILEVFNSTQTIGISSTINNQSTKSAIINNFDNLMGIYGIDVENVDLNLIAASSLGTQYEDDKELFMTLIGSAIEESNNIYNNFSVQYVASIDNYKDVSNQAYKFAWVRKLGHALIDYVEVHIGGERIDKHYGEWIDIWYELTGNKDMAVTYDKMIGNRPDLTTFDRNPKYDYTLFIPFQFWFCRYNGLALPLVAMQYSDVSIRLKLRKIEECCYVDEDLQNIAIQDIFDSQDSTIDIDVSSQNQFATGLKGSLYIDYIFLDILERRKFAQAGHEYLIDQLEIQTEEHNEEAITTVLDFNYCSKEIIWTAQKLSYIENIDQHTECMWWNFGVNENGSKNPVIMTKMEFTGYTIIPGENGNFFNYLLPYVRHKNTPSDGINIYSFALRPEEQQPTGACNMTRISQSRMYFRINPETYLLKKRGTDTIIGTDTIKLSIYSLRYNVLRIIGGYGALAFA